MCQTWPDVLTNVFYFANGKKATKNKQTDRQTANNWASHVDVLMFKFQMLSGLRLTVLLTVAIQVIQFTPLLTAKHMFLLTAQKALRTRRYKEILNSKTPQLTNFRQVLNICQIS